MMISVCIATYNGEKFLREQLMSILSQLSDEDEIIISDDNSQDSTISIIEAIKSPLLHLYVNNGECGYTANFENALRYAKGDYIFLADQDDIWMPDKVSVCVKFLQSYSLIISDGIIIDENGNKIGESFYEQRKSKKGLFNALLRFSFLGCCLAFRKEILQRAMPFPADHLLCTHDNWLTLIGMMYYKSIVIDDKLICYRRHSANSSSGGFINSTSIWFKIRYRVYLLGNLIIRGMFKSV
ncbi:glycosyltransferase family 2 protein [Hoylesella pleuritidis]|uniref:glycosyltransferase family 2 protein n=1 Tax=Hoylesella pleuritidis TaxID=407975 RepID=UPI0028D7D2A8|nr:glycosyltransferase family 2 protein [Hoylesella pleuritidis]